MGKILIALLILVSTLAWADGGSPVYWCSAAGRPVTCSFAAYYNVTLGGSVILGATTLGLSTLGGSTLGGTVFNQNTANETTPANVQTPTLGTVTPVAFGQTTPTKWMKIILSDGNYYYFPLWK